MTVSVVFHTFVSDIPGVGVSSPVNLNFIVMARPIEETPILKGEDARRFLKRMEEKHRVSQEEYDNIMSTYERLEKCTDWY